MPAGKPSRHIFENEKELFPGSGSGGYIEGSNPLIGFGTSVPTGTGTGRPFLFIKTNATTLDTLMYRAVDGSSYAAYTG